MCAGKECAWLWVVHGKVHSSYNLGWESVTAVAIPYMQACVQVEGVPGWWLSMERFTVAVILDRKVWPC